MSASQGSLIERHLGPTGSIAAVAVIRSIEFDARKLPFNV